MFTWRTLRTKLLVLFLSLLLIPVIGTGLYGQFFLSSTFRQQALDLEQQNLAAQAAQVRKVFIETQNNLIFLTEIRALKVLANSAPESDLYDASFQVLQDDFQSFARTHPLYQHIAYYNVIGDRVVSVEAKDNAIFVHDQESPDLFASFVEQVLRSPNGTTHLGIDELEDGSTRSMVFAFRSSDGVVLITLWSEQLFQTGTGSTTDGTWSLQLPIQTMLHFTSGGEQWLNPAINLHDDWQHNTAGYYIADENHVFYQNSTVPTMQDRYTIVLFHTLPSQRLQPDLSQFYQTFASLALGGLLCVIALGLFAIDRFVEPIRELKQSMDNMRRTGKTPALPKQLPPDEIGELSLAFYTMGLELETRRESERELVEKLINAQEEERKRIAYDLHDGLIQQLVGARFYLNQCKTQLADQFTEESQEMFNFGYDSLSSAIVDGRNIMQGLHPTTLDDLGLTEALEELIQNAMRQGNWQISLEIEPLTKNFDKVMSVTIYRIAQEALNNACKHAAAQHVSLKLWQDAGIHLIIEDDGVGFDVEQPPQSNGNSGWGLRTMKERVSLLHGTIEIDSRVGDGTIITIQIPEK